MAGARFLERRATIFKYTDFEVSDTVGRALAVSANIAYYPAKVEFLGEGCISRSIPLLADFMDSQYVSAE